jgi:hypothetical protein
MISIKKNKKAAIELSIGTIVILVIGMTMLVLGIVLVQNIVGGANDNVSVLNDKVRGEINNLFVEEGQKSVVRLAANVAKPKQGEDFGVAFGIKNTERSTTTSSNFQYTVVAEDLSADCQGLTKLQAESWIKSRKTGGILLNPGETGHFRIGFLVPEDAPLCIVPYNIVITKDAAPYNQDFFDLVIRS